jgi:hypothetical protein
VNILPIAMEHNKLAVQVVAFTTCVTTTIDAAAAVDAAGPHMRGSLKSLSFT